MVEILKVLNEGDGPIGARVIADKLLDRGYSIGERGVRYHLRILDAREFTKRKGYSGRLITEKGLTEINNALVGDRMGFVISRIQELLYRTTFDPDTGEGDVIINLCTIDKDDFEANIELMSSIVHSGYTVSTRHRILEEGEKISNITIPPGSVGLVGICSVTIDGVLLKKGIPVETRYGGLVQNEDGKATRFTDIISYTGTSIDPIKIFMAKKMTQVNGIIESGSGLLLANLREAPVISQGEVMDILERLRNADIGGVIEHIHAGDMVLGAPINPGRIGIPVYAGLNPVAALVEMGVDVKAHPVSAVMDYSSLDFVF